MKVLSLLQPWGSLVVLGHKKIETRSWNTKYRGELLIHASLGKNKEGYNLWHSKHCWDKVTDNKHFIELPFGAIIGKVNLIETFKFVEPLPDEYRQNWEDKKRWELTEQELAFGNYSPGRYGWLLSDPVCFETPIPVKGKLSLWDYDIEFGQLKTE